MTEHMISVPNIHVNSLIQLNFKNKSITSNLGKAETLHIFIIIEVLISMNFDQLDEQE